MLTFLNLIMFLIYREIRNKRTNFALIIVENSVKIVPVYQ